MMLAARSRSAFIALTLLTASLRAAAAQENPTIVVLVRHAEKAAQPADDPGLTPEGAARAEALIGAVGAVDAIFTTQFIRTRATAEPLARARGVPVTVVEYPVNPMAGSGGAAGYAKALAERIRREHRGQTVVVVGHSNTVPAIVEALGATPAGVIADSEYDHLFVVVLTADGARLVRAKFGERSAPG
jgi:broad specificity phosphatase PhoE